MAKGTFRTAFGIARTEGAAEAMTYLMARAAKKYPGLIGFVIGTFGHSVDYKQNEQLPRNEEIRQTIDRPESRRPSETDKNSLMTYDQMDIERPPVPRSNKPIVNYFRNKDSLEDSYPYLKMESPPEIPIRLRISDAYDPDKMRRMLRYFDALIEKQRDLPTAAPNPRLTGVTRAAVPKTKRDPQVSDADTEEWANRYATWLERRNRS